MNPMIHIAIENIGNEGMFGMFKENINRINAEVSFDQRKGADKKRKMHPIITIKNLALPAFAVEKNGMNMA